MSVKYEQFSVYLTDYQKKKLESCINKCVLCSLNIENKTTAAENTKLHLTEDQISKIIADKKNGKGSQIILSKTQLD